MSSAATGSDSELDDPRRGTGDAEAIIEAIRDAEPRTENLEDCPHTEEPVDLAAHMLPVPKMNNSPHSQVDHDHALPGFGEPSPDCGEFIPQAIYYCSECHEVHQKRHICNRYDCPQHAPYAIRRRVAGSSSSDTLGAAARLGALRAYLDAIRPHRQYYQGLIISPPEVGFWVTESGKPLQRTFDLVAEIMSHLGGEGVEGLVTYHPVRGENEEPGEDDRGEWKKRLFSDRDWFGDVVHEVRPSSHFHIRGAGYVDVSITDKVEEETGWVIHRLEDFEGNSMFDADAVARAMTYDLSHALVYTASDGSRRLAARWKGEHANEKLYNEREAAWRAAVYEASVTTLGIDPPEMECDAILETEVTHHSAPVEAVSGGWSFSSARTGGAASSGGTTATAAAPTSTTTVQEAERCGGELRHISQASEVLPELMARDDAADDLDAAYRAYVQYMEAKGLDPSADPTEVPELGDRPPPDELPI